jgi:hypothetical protein
VIYPSVAATRGSFQPRRPRVHKIPPAATSDATASRSELVREPRSRCVPRPSLRLAPERSDQIVRVPPSSSSGNISRNAASFRHVAEPRLLPRGRTPTG